MITKVKALTIIDLDELIAESVQELWKFISTYHIDNQKDITNLFTYYILVRILKIYKGMKGQLIFYLSIKCCKWLSTKGSIVEKVSFAKVIKLFTEKIGFPVIIFNGTYEELIKLFRANSPEYEEAINDYRYISSFMPNILNLIKKLKFYTLEEKLANNFREQLEIISCFK